MLCLRLEEFVRFGRERKQLVEDLTEQMTGHSMEEWMVMRIMRRQKQRLRERQAQDEDSVEGALGPTSSDDALVDYTLFDKDANERELRQLILNEKLMLAVDAEDTDEVVRLLDAGAEVNYLDVDFHHCRPLHLAAAHPEPVLLELLLGCGADPAARDGRNSSALHVAAALGLPATVEALLARGAAVDAADDDGRQALHVCAGRGHLDTVKVLLAHGADPDHRTAIGDTPLMAAAAWGEVAVRPRSSSSLREVL